MDSKLGHVQTCQYHQRGTCRFGGKCFNMHADAPSCSREWKYAKDRNAIGKTGATFTFMTYNVLADGLAQEHWSKLYRGIPRNVMEWPQRFLRLMLDLTKHQPDIVCLQEVDRLDDFRSQLGPLGYDGDYVQRTGGRLDGCATFWLREKFQEVHLNRLEFKDHGLKDNVALITSLQPITSSVTSSTFSALGNFSGGSCASGNSRTVDGKASHCIGIQTSQTSGGSMANDPPSSQDAASGPASPSTAVTSAFTNSAEALGGTPLLVVANTHILFNPSRGDVKVAQLRTLLETVDTMAAAGDGVGGSVCVIAGDFNSQPGSALHRFCRNGSLALATEDRRRMSGSGRSSDSPSQNGQGTRVWLPAEVEVAMGREPRGSHDLHVRHPLQLTSAYEDVTGAEADFSTYQQSSDGCGKTVDYIWSTSKERGPWQLKAVAVLASPSQEVLSKGLPSAEHPSDHVPLMAQFILQPAV